MSDRTGPEAARTRFFRALQWGALAFSLLNLSCSPGRGSINNANLVFVIADTLRADHLGVYGYPRPTSPFIDELAKSSVHFGSAMSTAPQTVPSVLSMMSSHYPNRHGNQFYCKKNSFRVRNRGARPKVPDSLPMLAEILAAEGFRTGAVVTNPWLKASYGFARGFETYLSLPEATSKNVIAKGAAVNQAAEAMLDEFGSERFFLYLHYMDVHNPYQPQEPYKSEFVGKRKGHKMYLNGPAPGMSEQDVQFNEAHYDGAIRGFDDRIRELYEVLRARGLDENTLFVFVSDHGEEFHEHGGLGHGWTLYEELIRIVLFFSHPTLAPIARRIDEPVSGVDVLPTLLELMGVERPRDLDGISLAPWVLDQSSDPTPPRRILLSELGIRKAARRGPKKLIWMAAKGKKSRAFDLSRDPTETRWLKKKSNWVADLSSALEALQPEVAEDQIEAVEIEDTEAERRMQKQLEWLGYIDESSDDSESPPSSSSSSSER